MDPEVSQINGLIFAAAIAPLASRFQAGALGSASLSVSVRRFEHILKDNHAE